MTENSPYTLTEKVVLIETFKGYPKMFEDKTLVKQCLDGDKNAFGKLVEKYQHMVHCLAFSYLKNFHDAEDVAQETFLKAYLSLRQLADATKFRRWLYKIARNISIRWLSRRPEQVISLSDVSLEDVSQMSMQRHRDNELAKELQDALELLPEKQRVPLLLSLAGFSHEEISGFLGVSRDAVRGRIERAKQAMRREILNDLQFEVNVHRLDRQFAQGITATISQLPTPAPPQSQPNVGRLIPVSVIGFLAVISIGITIFYLGRGRKETRMVQSAQPLPTFTDVTVQAGLIEMGNSLGVSSGDFDNDGDTDIYLTNTDGPANRLYQNNGNFTFTDVALLMGVTDIGKAYSGVFGDYDNDGDLDLYVANPSFFPNFFYRNDGANGFVDVTQQAGVSNTDESVGAIWGDYNSDGNLDLYVLNNGQANILFHNNGNGTFTDATQIAGVGNPNGSMSAAFFDYDNDGDLDLYVSNINAPCALYRNNGNGTFTDVTAFAGVENFTLSRDIDGNSALGIAIGDYDNDMDEDIYVANHGINALLRNNGNGTFTDVAAYAGVNYPLKSIGAIFFDYDKDGYLDLYVTNHRVANKLYHNNGNGTFTDVSEYSQVDNIGYNYGVAFADFDNDGNLDIFLADQGPVDPNIMYRNNGNGNNWLRVKLRGVQSNSSGIGAKVIVFTRTHRMLRTVNSGTGFCQPGAEVDFGLGADVKAEKVQVYWTSGRVQTFSDVAANQVVEVVER
jgi:RNA polymerase sigma factor (sigma-70 family)